MASKVDPIVMLANDMASFTHDPLAHALYAYPWGEGTLKDVHGPRDWQRDVMEDIREHLEHPATRSPPCRIARASGHGIGKYALIAMLVKWGLDTSDDTRIVFTANRSAEHQSELQSLLVTYKYVLVW